MFPLAPILQQQTTLVLASNATDTNFHNLVGNPAHPIDLLVINRSEQTNALGGNFAAQSRGLIINEGHFIGAGGGGGRGGALIDLEDGNWRGDPGADGQPGGPALTLGFDAIIVNAAGNVWGGGGGQGGDAGRIPPTSLSGDGGNGGVSGGVGGQAGNSDANEGNDGVTAPSGASAVPPAGGGDWGQAGGAADLGTASGGAAGKAIEASGFFVAITSGNNASQVKGVVE